ncbi:SET domain-containing protein [Ceratobasidium sp. AG-I]|nr:SET domain-containing protein [Ceratobasidium sp. AG-I]
MTGVVPTDDELTAAARSIKASNPALGIPKVLMALLSAQPAWNVSEKRLRKVIQRLKSEAGTNEYPTSSLNGTLDISKFTDKVQPVFFGPEKGKGLVAAEDIEAGQVLWREDPFVYAPPWEIYDAQLEGTACAFCARAFTAASPPLRVRCPHAEQLATAAKPPAKPCRATFCSRLCLARAGSGHSLLCTVANPACEPLLAFLSKQRWKAAVAYTKCVVRILAAWQDDAKRGGVKKGGAKGATEETVMNKDEVWETYRSFATLRNDRRWTHTSENDLARAEVEKLYSKTQSLLVQALYLAPTPSDAPNPFDGNANPSEEILSPERSEPANKALQKLFKVPIPNSVLASLFSRSGVLEGLGKVNLNLESHGGLFPLHSHLNHACTPNVSVRHIPSDGSSSPMHAPNPARITLIPVSPVQKGEELLVSYVNPSLGLRERRNELRAWDFGVCRCKRCLEEEKTEESRSEPVVKEARGNSKEIGKDKLDGADLEDELRGFLGV